MNRPAQTHMDDVYRILRYLKINPGKRIFFKKSSVRDIKMYTDADWDGSQADRRSTSEYCTFLWGNFDDLEKQKTCGGTHERKSKILSSSS